MVVLVDDEHLIRGALAQALTSDGLELIGEAANAQDAVRLVVYLRPDVVLMDIRLPGMPGVQAIERLGLFAPASRILILTRTEQTASSKRSSPAPAARSSRPRLSKRSSALPGATAAGETVLSSQIAGKLLDRIRERDIPVTAGSQDAASANRAALIERELAIFTRLATGNSNQDIARELSLRANTVPNHVTSILAELHLENRIQAAVHAVRSGIS